MSSRPLSWAALVVGPLLLLAGVSAFTGVLRRSPETVSIQDLESDKAELPPGGYVRVTGGHLYWQQGRHQAEPTPGPEGQILFKDHYIPLVSNRVAREWDATPREQPKNYAQVRAYVYLTNEEARQRFPAAASALSMSRLPQDRVPQVDVEGVVSWAAESVPQGDLRKQMADQTTDFDIDRMVLIQPAEAPGRYGLGAALLAAGVLLTAAGAFGLMFARGRPASGSRRGDERHEGRRRADDHRRARDRRAAERQG